MELKKVSFSLVSKKISKEKYFFPSNIRHHYAQNMYCRLTC